jgi:hypothetical protein
MLSFFSAMQTMLNTLPTSTAQTWHQPTQFWQTIESIQTLRAQAVSQWWQQAPQHWAAIQQAPTPAAKLGALANWQSQTVAQQWHLWAATQAHRTHLLQQLKPACTNPLPGSTLKPSDAAAATPAASNVKPTINQAIAPAKPAPAPITTTLSLLPLNEPTPKASPSNGTVSAIQVSRTAASVARTSNGSTIGAAAASRRSVVARRQNTRRAARLSK